MTSKEALNLIAIAAIAVLFLLKGGGPVSPVSADVLTAKQAGSEYLRSLADELDSYESPADERKAYEEIDAIFNRVGKEAFGPLNSRMEEMEYSPEGLDKLNRDIAEGLREVLK